MRLTGLYKPSINNNNNYLVICFISALCELDRIMCLPCKFCVVLAMYKWNASGYLLVVVIAVYDMAVFVYLVHCV